MLVRSFAIVTLLGRSAGLTRAAQTSVPARVIVIRDDRPDDRYRRLGERFPAVAKVGRAGDGTLIDPEWVLTAAHVTAASMRAARW